MMKVIMCLLFAVLISAHYTRAQCCLIDNAIDLKVKELTKSIEASLVSKLQMICTDVSSRGALVTCPSGYVATGCSCGSACGSWDIRSNTICHCQCANIDWTSARCCKIG
ncbi:resistin [Hemicordylus capensis]|uniref:resistin n=1 Tax=Hemicordylus capensis TaxID=884348 RepID=UPI002303B526|nr:resistin [Hemicordylus capensis]XP_053154610.1 resistin [Hemicordylus capensis]